VRGESSQSNRKIRCGRRWRTDGSKMSDRKIDLSRQISPQDLETSKKSTWTGFKGWTGLFRGP
jgi:hypothetical protein